MKMLITGAWNASPDQIEAIRKLGHEIEFLKNENDILPCPPEQIEGVICNSLFLHHPIGDFTKLRYVQLTSAGLDRIDTGYTEANRIILHNADGVYSIPMAEFVLSGILQIYKQTRFFYRKQNACCWEKNRSLMELYGKTACILGCGNLGIACGRLLQAFGMHTIGISRHPKIISSFADVADLDDYKDVLTNSDIVILALPTAKNTTGIINESAFSAMKDGSVIVNIARGALICQDALIKALNSKLLGAVLDVFEDEPLPADHPLWKMDNVILTPHNSFVSDGNGDRLFRLIYDNLAGVQYENTNNIAQKQNSF